MRAPVLKPHCLHLFPGTWEKPLTSVLLVAGIRMTPIGSYELNALSPGSDAERIGRVGGRGLVGVSV